MTVIDWDKNDVLNYLGTYFPRSYAESYCIFSEFFKTYPERFADKEEISIFDFGCGTGGEIIGLIDALRCMSKVQRVHFFALDGNYHALRLLERIFNACTTKTHMKIELDVIPLTIDDFYDLGVTVKLISKENFDIIMTFKAICEFVSIDRFEKQNAYFHFVRSFLPKLGGNGIMTIIDVSTYNSTSQEWLPRMLDSGIIANSCKVIMKNEGYNQRFSISHSLITDDVSKVSWRILESN
jgi:SAM-dependent methyltransferase